MGKKVPNKSFETLYYEYKDTKYSAIAAFILALGICLLLLLYFVIPQFQKWFEINNEVNATRQRIAALDANIHFIQGLDDGVISDDLTKATSALPVQKDFGGAMQTILASAITSGVSLKTFNFPVGIVSSRSATITPAKTNPLSIEISATGDGVSLKNFITALTTRLPMAVISEATNDINGNGDTKFTITFPSEPLSDITFDKLSPFTPLSLGDQKLLEQIGTWQQNSQNTADQAVASGGATLPPPF